MRSLYSLQNESKNADCLLNCCTGWPRSKAWAVGLSAAEQNNTLMIKLIELGAHRSVRGMPVPARALAPQPLPHVL